ncbi:MAG: glycosyltransferase [Paludibacter sp.]|nr:glycosyltransferase [Paludibacter sp.]
MKVIHILHELKFSGAEIMYVDAAPLFQEKGCELTVVATAGNLGEYAPFFEKAGYTVLHKPYPPLENYFKRIAYYIQFISFLKQNNYDVVHIHSSGTMWGMALCAWLAGKRSVYTFHNVFPTHFYSYPYHVLLRLSSKHIFKCRFQTISDSVYEHELKLYHNKTTKIYNWYGSKRFYPAADGEKTMIRKELEIQNDSVVLISIGGCSHIKRHSEIIKSLPMIVKKYSNILYLHLGKGEVEDDEIELAKKLGVSENVRFYGNQSDVRKYLIASDIYLMTSKFEGIPITTIETMACKIPTILYDVPGLRDFNKEMEVSVIIPPDYKTLADKIDFLISNPDVASQLSEKANLLVNNKFYMQKNVESIFNLYQRSR